MCANRLALRYDKFEAPGKRIALTNRSGQSWMLAREMNIEASASCLLPQRACYPLRTLLIFFSTLEVLFIENCSYWWSRFYWLPSLCPIIGRRAYGAGLS